VTAIIDIDVTETSYDDATRQIQMWAQGAESRVVYATGMHGTMEAHDTLEFRNILRSADMITPDGMPLVWMLRLKGVKNQQRVYGPTLMLHLLEMSANTGIPVGFYGANRETLAQLVVRMKKAYPALQIKYAFSPPYRPLEEQEVIEVRKQIVQSGVRILFVGLGCPRQERWIDGQRGYIPAVMVGVGAAFDFHAGEKKQAPTWLQKMGLEWFYRLLSEPRRLWKRYLYHIPRFIVLAIADLLGLFKRVDS
jgi:N-acetylglucosaminyldiphosphoundecaprenol N-acetyl-beta-D-mannosaminyltransferase